MHRIVRASTTVLFFCACQGIRIQPRNRPSVYTSRPAPPAYQTPIASYAGRRDFLTAAGFGASLWAAFPLAVSATSGASSSQNYVSKLPPNEPDLTPLLPLTQAQEALSGLVGGAAQSSSKTLVKHPLDTVTVRLQVARRDGKGVPRRDVLFRGLYSGVTPTLLSGIPSGALFFSVKDGAKSYLRSKGFSKAAATLLGVLVAQFPYWALRNPSEVLKTKAQAVEEGEAELTFWEAARAAAASEGGVATLWKGYGENIAAAYPADALKFGVYETMSGAIKRAKGRAENSKLPPLEGAVIGALATALSQAATTPLDVVRNRAMLEDEQVPKTGTKEVEALAGATARAATEAATNIDKENAVSTKNKENFAVAYWRTLSTIAREEGFSALWVGLSPRVGKAMLSGAVQFGTYEVTKGSMSNYFTKKGEKSR